MFYLPFKLQILVFHFNGLKVAEISFQPPTIKQRFPKDTYYRKNTIGVSQHTLYLSGHPSNSPCLTIVTWMMYSHSAVKKKNQKHKKTQKNNGLCYDQELIGEFIPVTGISLLFLYLGQFYWSCSHRRLSLQMASGNLVSGQCKDMI